MRQIMERALTMVEKFSGQMAAMKTMCVYRLNGCCWYECRAKEYCRPEDNGLRLVSDILVAAP